MIIADGGVGLTLTKQSTLVRLETSLPVERRGLKTGKSVRVLDTKKMKYANYGTRILVRGNPTPPDLLRLLEIEDLARSNAKAEGQRGLCDAGIATELIHV